MKYWTTTLSMMLLVFCKASLSEEWNGSLEDLLRSQPARFATVMKDPANHRLQIIYTQIDRDSQNRPSFNSYNYRLNETEYFYPASTIKLPVALLALEKLKRLNINGLHRDTVMLTRSASKDQTAALIDETTSDGLPRVSQYVKKILLVSDNNAFNRLYEFVGHESINKSLKRKGYENSRIVHRLEVALGTQANRHTNPIQFFDGKHTIYEQPAQRSNWQWSGKMRVLLGTGERIGGRVVKGPKDFSYKNCFPLKAMHDVIKNLIFPDQADEGRFDLSSSDYDFVYRYMSASPREGGISKYLDRQKYPDGYVKFLMYGGSAASIPSNIRVFNKVGSAYGFLTDAAYVVDFENKIEFLLAATIYTNANQTFNDGQYEYENIGFPFLRDLGQAIYELERNRSRKRRPVLKRMERFRPYPVKN